MPAVEKTPDFLSKEEFDVSKRSEYFLNSTVAGERSFDRYAERLGFSAEDLRGKLVLDVGSSENERFSKEAAAQGINVISLNPELADERIRKLLLEGEGPDNIERKKARKSVAGVVQELPFLDNVFDATVAYWSVPVYLPPFESEHRTAFQEVLRVLKPGGTAYFFPILEGLKWSKVFKSIREDLSGLAQVELEPVGEDTETGEVISRLIIRKK